MSLFLAYHDKSRCAVVSDDRVIAFSATGGAEPLAHRVPKFITCGGFIFALVGSSEVCGQLGRGFQRMLADHPQLTIVELAQILPAGFERCYARRRRDKNLPVGSDNLEAAILGFDAEAKRMRSFVFVATDHFAPVETTTDPNARVFALGHYHLSDSPVLDRLTSRMQVADKRRLPWIVSCLRDTLHELHGKYPVNVEALD